MASPSLQANTALSLTVQSGQMYAESFPNSIDLIVLLCSACVFVLVCLSVYRINTIRNVITETRETSAQIRTVEQNELQILTRDTQYQLRRDT